MLTGKYKALYQNLINRIDKERIFHDALHTLAYGTDASFYRLIPKLVIRAKNEDEVRFILKNCAEMNLPVTFRAAGTSLSGQAISDSVLVIAGDNWKQFKLSPDGSRISLQPGITGGHANSLLTSFGKKIGPDPASINSAMIGGIAANNASGMCCGTSQNSYKTVRGMRIILADGTVLDTRNEDSRKSFRHTHEKMLSEIALLATDVADNQTLTEKIRKKYRIKNTTGYSLNALVDYSDPFDIIEHLMIGSEGTLGFISEITYETVDNDPLRASSLMMFPDIASACKAVILLKKTPVAAVELIDRPGLRSVESEKGMPEYLRSLDAMACALLVETTAQSKKILDEKINSITASLTGITTLRGIHFTDIPDEYGQLWKIRKGLFPSAGAMRKTGTTVIIEDVAFPIETLAESTCELQSLLNIHGYHDAVIFGHALEGNLHFVFAQDFNSQEQVKRYSELMNDVATMVAVRYEGSLKAEHGTGRNMAPFVELEWGKDAYSMMKRIKNIFDPQNILNPGVILNSDSDAHLKDLKPVPPSSEITDKCTECGFCEASCVSADLTITPRQRIVIHREISWLRRTGEQPHIAAELSRIYDYDGDHTCATDGLCALACPVKIDCGKLIKSLRAENVAGKQAAASWIGNHMAVVTGSARKALNIVHLSHLALGSGIMKGLSSGLRALSLNTLPAWNRYMPVGSSVIRYNQSKTENVLKVVYFPSCINRSMGVSREYRKEKQLSEVLTGLLIKGGYDVIFPENLNNLCCGMAFSSKGYTDVGKKKSDELEAELIRASDNGKYPVICDMSPCLYTMKENIHSVTFYEPVEFILKYLVKNLDIKPLDETISVFPVCSMKKMELDGRLLELARMCAKDVVMPVTNCCGFAGDRGFTFPELNRHGLRHLKKQLPENVTHGYSTSRTCEIGLSLHSGISFKSIIYLVDKVSAPKSDSAITHMQ